MTKTVLFAALIALGACSDKPGTTEKPTGTAASTPASKPAPEARVAAPVADQLTCEKIASKELLDKYFPGATVANIPHPVPFSAQCQVTQADKTKVDLNAQCHDNVKSAKAPTIEGLKKNFANMKELPGVGDPVLVQPIADLTQFSGWDNDSNCSIAGMLPKSVDASAFLKDWLAQLPPK
jgi:hypothetical protein